MFTAYAVIAIVLAVALVGSGSAKLMKAPRIVDKALFSISPEQ